MHHPKRQRGFVLILALIVLVAMSLAAVALLRSVSTTNLIAGNLAFQQAATASADQGMEAAAQWLTANSAALTSDNTAQGYLSYRQDPTITSTAVQSWDDFWTNTLSTAATPVNVFTTASPDAAGNAVSYVIQRMCATSGTANTSSNVCSVPPTNSTPCPNCSQDAGTTNPLGVKPIYYRITVRVAGPRNTVTYTQAMVSL